MPDLPPTYVYQVSPDDDARLKAGLADIAEIDKELSAITEHQDSLSKSRAARLDEIVSLKTRSPEIKLDNASTVRQIYRAL